MLGKLFNLGSGAVAGAAAASQTPGSKAVSSLDSVQEDIHTRNLLFPDAQALYQPRNDQVFPLSSLSALPGQALANAFDYDGDIELDSRDIRVVILQDAMSSMSASLLYDSQPAPPPPPPTSSYERPSTTGALQFSLQDARRVPTASRKSSLSQSQRPVVVQPGSPQPRQGTFDRRGSSHSRTLNYAETESQRAWREYREELATFSSCIFGNSELMAYKGTSTKVHVVPSDTRSGDLGVSIGGDGRSSIGRSSTRSSRLAQSFSSEAGESFNVPPSGSALRGSERRKILITRLFPVNLPAYEDPVASSPIRFSEEESTGYPFPLAGDETKPKKKTPKPKKTPMYAVALVINLPQGSSQPPLSALARPGFRGPGSFTEQEPFSSSYGSNRRSDWTLVGPGQGLDSYESAFSSDVEDRMDAITQRWDIIMRTLTHLQSVVATTLFSMLKLADVASPDPFSTSITSPITRTTSLTGRRGDDGVPPRPTKMSAKIVALLPNCLLDNAEIKSEVDVARTRLVTGLRATRVVTGQNRWGIWRDEARWVAKWCGGREQGYFFFNLLTGFLATHTDWLQALGPMPYRQRHSQQKARSEEDASLPARTIIISDEKMTARRLVFLLSAFLPANQQLPVLRAHRSSTSASFGALSHSPPSYVVPILKEESLRRKINRRAAPRRGSHSRNQSLQGQSGRGGVPPPLTHLSMDGHHSRRPSDAASVKTADLPIPVGNAASRKSSAATTTTVQPEEAIPYFSSALRDDSGIYARPGSRSSIAANDLKRSLSRGGSTGQHSMASGDSRQSSRWGSVISGFWNTKRRDSSTPNTVHTHTSSDDNTAVPTAVHGTPEDAAKEAVLEEETVASPLATESSQVDDGPSLVEPQTPRQFYGDEPPLSPRPETLQRLQRTPDPSSAFESPVKTSINVEDGVIDVDVPFPEYLTAFETAVSSPSSSGYLSTQGFGLGLDAFEQACRVSVDGESSLNVAGWLQQYHPDFVLQSLPPQDGLVDEIKASLRAEPSPPPPSGPAEAHVERWMDVSSAVIADTTSFTITRLRYRRLVMPKPSTDRSTPMMTSSLAPHTTAPLTPSISPYEIQLQEEMIEETIGTLDEALVEAVEKVIALGTDGGKDSSNSSSRSTSKRRERSNSESAHSDEVVAAPGPAATVQLEVPRAQCKTVILSALDRIVHEVLEKREKERRGGQDGVGGREKENSLRQAVRGWLEFVELSV